MNEDDSLLAKPSPPVGIVLKAIRKAAETNRKNESEFKRTLISILQNYEERLRLLEKITLKMLEESKNRE